MISYKEAIRIFKNKYPDQTITLVLDYDKDWWVIEAPKNLIETDYDAPYYGVNKKDGRVAYYSPGGDFDTFFAAIENRCVYKNAKG